MTDLRPEHLIGVWEFERTVDDRRAGETIAVEGTARFERVSDDRIEWVEHGTMHLAAGDVPVTTTRVLTHEDAGSWSVDFADGRGFHAWQTGVLLTHDCAPDVYRGRLDPAALGWTMTWTATGPAKDYTSDTTYRRPGVRAADGPGAPGVHAADGPDLHGAAAADV